MRDEDVLIAAIQEGLQQLTWQTETFAYAEGFDEARRRYKGLRAGEVVRVLLDGQSVLVKPEAALTQMRAEAQQTATKTTPDDDDPGGSGRGGGAGPAPPLLRRFHASVAIDPLRLGRDASQIAQEVVQHLTRGVGVKVEITLEIHADLPEGASEKLVRDVTENCRTLGFTNYGFEEA
jgi:hypothetical protein